VSSQEMNASSDCTSRLGKSSGVPLARSDEGTNAKMATRKMTDLDM
jgi:hypothetical protein